MQKTSDAAPTLAELDKAATQGEWKEAMFSDGLCIYAEREPGFLGERVMKLFRWLGDSPTREKNIEFVVALVNAYRAGRLREVPEGEYICTCGIRVSPHRCPTGSDF